jgi:hypothetical protein
LRPNPEINGAPFRVSLMNRLLATTALACTALGGAGLVDPAVATPQIGQIRETGLLIHRGPDVR